MLQGHAGPDYPVVTCPYGRRLDEGYPVIVCQKLSDAAGFTVSICDPHCRAHEEAGGPEVPIADVPRLAAVLTASLSSRIIGGDCPMYQGPNPVDIVAAAGQLKALLSEDDRRPLLHEIADKWSELSNMAGGHPVEVVEQKLKQLARAWDMESELDRWTARLIP